MWNTAYLWLVNTLINFNLFLKQKEKYIIDLSLLGMVLPSAQPEAKAVKHLNTL